jgi:hypothetical protein
MSSGGDLSTSVINLEAIKENGSSELLRILDAHSGTKALVIDPSLSGPLGLIIGVKLMKEHNVTEFYLLNTPVLRTNCDHVIYLIRPETHLIRLMIDQIQGRGVNSASPTYSAYMVSRHTIASERMIEEAGLDDILTVSEYQLDLVPFDADVVSLEQVNGFRSLFLDCDSQCIYDVARSLIRLQLLCGTIPLVKGKGFAAHRVAQLMHRLSVELGEQSASCTVPSIESVVLIDRLVDLPSALLPQNTYEGLLDETYGIRNNAIEAEIDAMEAHKQAVQQANSLGKPPPPRPAADAPPVKRKHLLNSHDAIFSDLRVLGPFLHKKASLIKKTYDERDSDMSVQAMHDYWGRFKQAHREHALLQTHISLAEAVSVRLKSRPVSLMVDRTHNIVSGEDLSVAEAYLDNLICTRADIKDVYRVLTLMGATNTVSVKRAEQWRRDIVQAYGFEEMGTLYNLEKLGLLPGAGATPRKYYWDKVRKAFNLTVPRDSEDRKETHQCYHDYAPLSARIVDIASTTGALRKAETLTNIPGPAFEYRQALPPAAQRRLAPVQGYSLLPALSSSVPPSQTQSIPAEVPASAQQWLKPDETAGVQMPGGGEKGKPVCLVYFLGGVTMAEISAIRQLSEQKSHKYHYVVATTKLVQASGIVDAIAEPLPNHLIPDSSM